MRIGFALMMGASSSFISPFGYQTNLMVFNAGNLKFWDLAKIGIFFQVCLFVCSLPSHTSFQVCVCVFVLPASLGKHLPFTLHRMW